MYLDGIVVFLRSPRYYTNHSRHVLPLLRDVGVTLKLKKCSYYTGTTDYLGHVICLQCLEIATHTTDTIRGLKRPTNIAKLCSYLELWNVFCRFVTNFARIAAPLYKRLEKDQPKCFGALIAGELIAMHASQEKLVSPPVLALPSVRERNRLDTNACSVQAGWVLLHEQTESTTKPIGCWSRSVTNAEKAHRTRQRERLAAVWLVFILWHCPKEARFWTRTDYDL